MDTWHHEMRRANGESFHMSFLSFFRLHVRLFLNSFGIQAAMSPVSFRVPFFFDPKADRARAVEPHNSKCAGLIGVFHKREGKFTYRLERFRINEHACRLDLIFWEWGAHHRPALRSGFHYGNDGIFCRLPVEGMRI